MPFSADDPNINRNGRPPKGYSITETFREMFKSEPDKKVKLATVIFDKAIAGDMSACRLIWEHLDGKAPMGLSVELQEPEEVDPRPIEERLQEMLERIKEALVDQNYPK